MPSSTPRRVLYLAVAVIIAAWALAFAETVFHLVDLRGLLRLDLQENLLRTSLVLLAKAAILVGFVYGVLRLSRQRHGALGFEGRRLGRQIAVGGLFGLGIFVLETFLLSPVLEAVFPRSAAEDKTMAALLSSAANLPLLLALGILKGGFVEEYWRIFVLTRFEAAFRRPGLIVALLVGSVVFGLGHSYQGTAAIYSIAIVGLAYAGVYLRRRRAIEAMAAHATYDVVAILLGFLMYRQG